MDNLIPIISMSCVLVLWSGIMLILIRTLSLGLRSKSWPKVYGKILQSEITKVKRSETGSILSKYRVVIQYEYTVNDISYKSQTLSYPDQAWQILNRGLRSQQSAKQLQTKYPISQSVEVHYNPKNPRQSVLEPVIFDMNLILMLMTLLVMGVFFAAMFIN